MEILEFLRAVPKGKVVTYSMIARKFGIHPRRVASILRANKQQDIYPCYKVVMADGRIGGYNLGVKEKIRRLRSEGIEVVNGRIPRRFIWEG